MSKLIPDPTRILFFTGKGGVGKTSSACATAIDLADSGKRVLLVSTDPASNLDEMLMVPLGPRATPLPAVPRANAERISTWRLLAWGKSPKAAVGASGNADPKLR